MHAPAAAPDDIEREHVRLLSTLVEILIAHTLLPAEKFVAVLEEAFEAGLTHKLEVGRPYQELADFRGSSDQSPAHGINPDPLGHDCCSAAPCRALLADARIQGVFAELRAKGWKDWHLLSALANLVINTRVAACRGTPTWGAAASFREHFLAELNRPEEPHCPG